MRRITVTSSPHRSGRRASHRGDSGSTQRSATAATMGTSPPMTNSVRHPSNGNARMPSSPASVPPSGTQTMAMVTAMGRRLAGTYSAASAAAFGIAPPSPRPAKNRSVPNAAVLSDIAAASVITPKTTMLPSSAVCRPILSPARPAAAPPSIMPRYPSETTGANSLRGTPHSRITVGMTMPSSWLSMPSKTIVSATSATRPFW